jgi:hypothetical protein
MSVEIVKNKIKDIFATRVAQIEALDRLYASMAIIYFNSVQPPQPGRKGKFWHNILGEAALRMFAKAFREGLDFGWFISHGVDYGVYLTFCNDRRNDALTPIIKRFSGRYYKDIQRLYGDK